jgi:hypothetical protein
MTHSDSIVEITKALVAVQKKMVPVKKSADNPFFKSKYAPLDKVMPSALKLLNEQGIAVLQPTDNIVTYSETGGNSALTTTLLHTSGEWISSTQPLVLDKDNPQGQGSAITYARRYALMSMIGMVADEDDDGNVASSPKQYSDRGPATKGATVKQIDWMRKVAQQVTGLEEAGDLDEWIEEILTIPPHRVPIAKAKDAVDKLLEQKKPVPTTDPKAPPGGITDEDIAKVERGELDF